MTELTPALKALAERRMLRIKASADLELQFEKHAKYAPIKVMLAKAREQALAAMDALIFCEPNKTETIRSLQFEVRRYDDLVAWLRDTIIEGLDDAQALDQEAKEEIARLMSTREGREQADGFGQDDEGSD